MRLGNLDDVMFIYNGVGGHMLKLELTMTEEVHSREITHYDAGRNPHIKIRQRINRRRNVIPQS